MKIAQSGCSQTDRHQLSTILADRCSRRIIDCLQPGPLTARDLAVTLAADESDCARSAVGSADREEYRQLLEHSALPRLTDAGLVDRGSDGLLRYVPAALDQYEIQFPALDEPDHSSWPAVAAVLGRAYRHPLLSLVADSESVSLSRLAALLVETDSPALGESSATPRSLSVTLHHVDLPKLAAVDLLEYDTETRTATPTAATETVL
jgi:hypothetical protein